MSLDKLNRALLVACGVKPEVVDIVMERINDLEAKLSESLQTAQNALREKHELKEWKISMLTVESWWKKIDLYVREDARNLIGDSISGKALERLKRERHQHEILLQLAEESKR